VPPGGLTQNVAALYRLAEVKMSPLTHQLFARENVLLLAWKTTFIYFLNVNNKYY
jgi:hypothetical protein